MTARDRRAAGPRRGPDLGAVRSCTRSFRRTPAAAFFTLVFPMSFLVIISAIVGDPMVDERTGVRLAQFLAPVFAVFGVAGRLSSRSPSASPRARRGRPQTAARDARAGVDRPRQPDRDGGIVPLSALLVAVGVGGAVLRRRARLANPPDALLTLILGVFCCAALGLAAVSSR